jgi:hypothetical protein
MNLARDRDFGLPSLYGFLAVGPGGRPDFPTGLPSGGECMFNP